MIVNDHEALKKEKSNYVSLPVVRKVEEKDINLIYHIIKQEIQDIVELVMDGVFNQPEKKHLLVKKNINNYP